MKISVTGTSGFIGKALCDKLVSLNYVISVLTRKDTLYIADISALVSLLLLFYRNKFDCVHALMPKSAVLAMVAAWVVLTKVRIHFLLAKTGLASLILVSMDKLVSACAANILADSSSQRDFLIAERLLSVKK